MFFRVCIFFLFLIHFVTSNINQDDLSIRSRSLSLSIFREPIPILNNITCPSGFILFNNLCYYVDISIVNNIRTGEQVCSTKYENSTLVIFDSHQLSNVNATRFLGRAFDDILLEFFYYHLEQKLNIELKMGKDWSRLLFGNKSNKKGCVLRYFNHSSGEFTISPRCDQGGHPVCQSPPILISETMVNTSEINVKSESKMKKKSFRMIFKRNVDESRDNNKTNGTDSNSTPTSQRIWKRSLVASITVPILSLITLIGIVFVVYYIRRDRGFYPIRKKRSKRRGKELPMPVLPDETFKESAVLYNLFQISPPSIITDVDTTDSIDDLCTKIDQPTDSLESVKAENTEEEKEEEPYYATVKSSNDK